MDRFPIRQLATVCLISVALSQGGTKLLAQAANEALPAPLESQPAKASYAIGLGVGRNLANGGVDAQLLDLKAFVIGIEDALKQAEPRIDQAQLQAAMQQFEQIARGNVAKKMQAIAEKNRRDGPVFINKYKTMNGVNILPSGLMYRVLKAGTGPSPKATDVVKTHYRGKFVDGSQFDSSFDNGEPAIFPVTGVIPGWTEALQKMKVGDRWELVIPSDLAYGPQGSPPVIGPDSVLVFEIELLGIEQPPTGSVPQQ